MKLIHVIFHLDMNSVPNLNGLGTITRRVTEVLSGHGMKPAVKYPDLLDGRDNDSVTDSSSYLYIGLTDISGYIPESRLTNMILWIGQAVTLRTKQPVQITGELVDVRSDAEEMEMYHKRYDEKIADIFAEACNPYGHYEDADALTKKLLSRCFIRTRLHYLGWRNGDPVVEYLREKWQGFEQEGRLNVGLKDGVPVARWKENIKMKIE